MAGTRRRRVTSDAGEQAERRASRFLRRRGLDLLASNFRCRYGELDLIMRDGPNIVFVEVRFRSRSRFADAAGSIDEHKQARLTNAASVWLADHPRFDDAPVRFDVVAFDEHAGRGTKLEWIRDAFRP